MGWVSIEAVPAFLSDGDMSDLERLNALRSKWVKLPAPPSDPWSPEYREHWLSVYETLSGRGYDVSSEESVIDVETAIAKPFPYSTRDPLTVADHLAAVAATIKAMNLPVGASVLELGAGWGNTSVALAQMGYDVTVLDVEERFIQLVERRSKAIGIPLETIRGDFFEMQDIDRKFDALLFFESFHHCIDHQNLLDALAVKLNPGGKLVLAGETINDELPYAWGLNPNGESVFQISTKGWMELAFRESYLLETLRRKGWSVVRHDEVHTPAERVYVCTRMAEGA